MRVLIDTHTFLWFVSEPEKLSDLAKNKIENADSTPLVSIVSVWEISIKTSLGKLDVVGGFQRVEHLIVANSIEILPIEFSHTLRNNILPYHHRDPFDRMIAAQALVEEIDLVSRDDVFDHYFENSGVKRIWD